MMRLDTASLEYNIKRLVGVTEGVSAITLNKNEPIICQHAQALVHPFLAIRKCKGAITPEMINISLDGTNLAWSPNLHLRLLKLWLESTNFRSIINKNSSIVQGFFLNIYFLIFLFVLIIFNYYFMMLFFFLLIFTYLFKFCLQMKTLKINRNDR